MPRPKTGDKRAAIIEAAIEMIGRDGLGASTASIAKGATVAEGSLFRYFTNKDKLLNDLYRELKRDIRRAMIADFPQNASLRKRVQHIWDAYVRWGMEWPAKRQAILQLNLCARITEESRAEGKVGFEDAQKAMSQLVSRGRLCDLPQAFVADLLLAMAETTMAAMAATRVDAVRYQTAGFEAFWNAVGKR